MARYPDCGAPLAHEGAKCTACDARRRGSAPAKCPRCGAVARTWVGLAVLAMVIAAGSLAFVAGRRMATPTPAPPAATQPAGPVGGPPTGPAARVSPSVRASGRTDGQAVPPSGPEGVRALAGPPDRERPAQQGRTSERPGPQTPSPQPSVTRDRGVSGGSGGARVAQPPVPTSQPRPVQVSLQVVATDHEMPPRYMGRHYGTLRSVVRNPLSETLRGVRGRARWYWTGRVSTEPDSLRGRAELIQRGGGIKTDFGWQVRYAEAYCEPADLYPGQTGVIVLVPKGEITRHEIPDADSFTYGFYALRD